MSEETVLVLDILRGGVVLASSDGKLDYEVTMADRSGLTLRCTDENHLSFPGKSAYHDFIIRPSCECSTSAV